MQSLGKCLATETHQNLGSRWPFICEGAPCLFADATDVKVVEDDRRDGAVAFQRLGEGLVSRRQWGQQPTSPTSPRDMRPSLGADVTAALIVGQVNFRNGRVGL